MQRQKDSHKGQNGKIMIVGGSAMFHGAPILCSLGAEFSGVDLVFPWIPPVHAQTARNYSLNFILHTFEKDILIAADVKNILEFTQNVDAIVVGPGLGDHKYTQKAIKDLLANLKIPTVIDASALVFTNQVPTGAVLTPHRGEFKQMTGDDPTPENAQKWAKHFDSTIVIKGPEDIIADAENLTINKTGNALMTVGGTGDVLSGLIGGLIAQGHSPFDAAVLGARILGEAGDKIASHQKSLRAYDLLHEIPKLLP